MKVTVLCGQNGVLEVDFNATHCCRIGVDQYMEGRKCPEQLKDMVGIMSFEAKEEVPEWYVPAVGIKIVNTGKENVFFDDLPTIEGNMVLASGGSIDGIQTMFFAGPADWNKRHILKPGEELDCGLQGEFGLLAVQAFNNLNGKLCLKVNEETASISLDEFSDAKKYCKKIIGDDYSSIREKIKKYFLI